MSEAEELNAVLRSEAPAAYACLSPLGRRAVFPKGIPYQAAAARSTRYKATAGQVTDGHGNPLPLPQLVEAAGDLDPKTTFLYTPIEGSLALRQAWQGRMRRLSQDSNAMVSLPFATHGLTHGLAILAELFADEDTDVVIPTPYWENYKLLFTLRAGARVLTFPFFADGAFNTQGLEDTLKKVRGKSIVLLNIPGNPTGFTPRAEQATEILATLAHHDKPMVVVADDAYAGTTWESGLLERSLFWDLAETLTPEQAVVFKVDGATKELLFFSSRIGFLTHTAATEGAERAMLSKMRCMVRASVGCPSGPAQAMVIQALANPDIDGGFAERAAVLRARYLALKSALADASDVLKPYPFNSAYFALVGLREGIDADALRRKLIADHSVGTIYVPSENALRIAYCSLSEDDVPELVQRLETAALAS